MGLLLFYDICHPLEEIITIRSSYIWSSITRSSSLNCSSARLSVTRTDPVWIWTALVQKRIRLVQKRIRLVRPVINWMNSLIPFWTRVIWSWIRIDMVELQQQKILVVRLWRWHQIQDRSRLPKYLFSPGNMIFFD